MLVNVFYLLNDAIFNVDICFLGEVVVDHLPSFDEDTHGPHVDRNSPTGGMEEEIKGLLDHCKMEQTSWPSSQGIYTPALCQTVPIQNWGNEQRFPYKHPSVSMCVCSAWMAVCNVFDGRIQ